MNHQSDSYIPGFLGETQGEVNRYGQKRVQRMKTDATSLRIIDRVGQEMIQIYEYRAGHYQVTDLPISSEKQARDHRWHEKMKHDMH